jgi:hypothetical protein
MSRYCVRYVKQAADPDMLVVNLSRNYGHQIVLQPDYRSVVAELILDADLKGPPEPRQKCSPASSRFQTKRRFPKQHLSFDTLIHKVQSWPQTI